MCLEIMVSLQDLLHSFKTIIPPLTNALHKGSMGRVGVFGGSPEFTGAPYFAGISSLKCGSDLVYVFSASSAAPVIKCYSPDLMVMPYLDSEDAIGLTSPWLSRLHSVLIGPGLGRKNKTFATIKSIVKSLKSTKIEEQWSFKPLIFDADGIYFVIRNLDLLKDYPGDIYLTPNKMEFEGLLNALNGHECKDTIEGKMNLIAQQFTCKVTIVLKGSKDIIFDGNKILECDTEGSPRRSGGQGDMLSGVLSTFASWVAQREKPASADVSDRALAAVAACAVTRTCSRLAFKKKSRSMLTTDMIEEIGSTFKILFHTDS